MLFFETQCIYIYLRRLYSSFALRMFLTRKQFSSLVSISAASGHYFQAVTSYRTVISVGREEGRLTYARGGRTDDWHTSADVTGMRCDSRRLCK